MLVVGGAAIVTGAVLVYINRGRVVYDEERPTPTVTFDANGASLTIVGRF